MPLTSVSALPPRGDRPSSPSTEPTSVLAKRVAARGKCNPSGAAMTVTASDFQVSAVDDPWFPPTQVEADLEALARKACGGCPVMASCLELTLRTEQRTGDFDGLAGGLAPHERRALSKTRTAIVPSIRRAA